LGTGPNTLAGFPLPRELKAKQIVDYDDGLRHDLRGAIRDILSKADPVLIGKWKESSQKSLSPMINLS
jgi:hypothetical protein